MRKQNLKNKKIGIQNLKFMIASFSISATLALWGIFSAQDQKGEILQIETPKTIFIADMPPIPTVVPQNGLLASVDQPTNQESTEIRSVSQPELNFAQAPNSSSNPEVIIISGNSNGGGGGGSATSTKAS
jgi:hypothetical protein